MLSEPGVELHPQQPPTSYQGMGVSSSSFEKIQTGMGGLGNWVRTNPRKRASGDRRATATIRPIVSLWVRRQLCPLRNPPQGKEQGLICKGTPTEEPFTVLAPFLQPCLAQPGHGQPSVHLDTDEEAQLGKTLRCPAFKTLEHEKALTTMRYSRLSV